MSKTVIIGGIILLLGIIIILITRNPFGEPSINVDLSHSSVVKEIQSLGRLETSSFTIEKIVEAGKSGNVFQNLLYGDRILLIAHGKVTAGVDLTNLDEDSVKTNGKSITVELSAPFIFQTTLDNEKTTVYDRSQGILSRGDKDLESEARLAAQNSITEAACEAGILEEASIQARKRLTDLFRFAGFETITINIPLGDC